jgi:hypothetical protein
VNDYAAYIPVVNRFDLLKDAITNARDVADELTVVDNSPEGKVHELFPDVQVFRTPIPMTFTQSMNFEFWDTRRKGKKFCLHMHSDSLVPVGAIHRLLEKAREVEESGVKWGVIYSFYDIMAIYNPIAGEAVGGYDINFPAYFSDNDFYRRLKLAGYECLESGISVGHMGSQTINSDPFLKFLNGVTFPLYRQYYIAKWGGEPGQETFRTPFNLPENYIQTMK